MGCGASPHNRYCLPEYETRSDARAFYMMDTHDYFRQSGCEVEWVPERDLTNFPELADEPGAFVGGCSGSIWLRDGTRVFGPAPRDLDEFAVDFEERVVDAPDGEMQLDLILIDTRELICGRTSDGERAEECAFAPAFD